MLSKGMLGMSFLPQRQGKKEQTQEGDVKTIFFNIINIKKV